MRHDVEKRFARWGLAALLAVVALSTLVAGQLDVFERVTLWTREHEQYELDEVGFAAFVAALAVLVYSLRRARTLAREIARLELAVTEAKMLRALETVCEDCESAGQLCGTCRALYQAPVAV
jgi:hypothetical protein